MPEFQEWKQETENWHTWKTKYYKGLGTSSSKEAKEYFQDMVRHRIKFRYNDQQDDHSIQLAFSKKCIDQRKEWLTNWMEEGKKIFYEFFQCSEGECRLFHTMNST